MILIGAHRLAYVPVPKAGCSTVKQLLSQIDPKYPRKFKRMGEPQKFAEHVVYPTRRFAAARFEKLNARWFRFCVIRDPLKRLLSCYTNRVLQMKDLEGSMRIKRGWADLPTDPDPDFFFQNLGRFRRGSSQIRHHSITAKYFVGKDLSIYDRVCPIEQLDSLFEELSARTGEQISPTRKNKSSVKLELDALQPKTRDCLRKELRREYKFLSDYYDNPFN